MSDKYTGLPFETTARLLDSAGFDPSTVLIDGLTEGGYFTFVYDANGKKVLGKDEVEIERRNWGTEFGAKVLIAHQIDLNNGAERKIKENQQ